MSRSSSSEDERMARAERMVRSAVDAHPAFDGYRSAIKVYAKGSYANLTNVRADSDVDVVVENHDLFYYDYFPASIRPSPDPNSSPYVGRWSDPHEWRREVEASMKNAFGSSQVDTSGNVAMTIAEVPGSRPSADVVPSFNYRRFGSADRSDAVEGSRVIGRDGSEITNYPTQQKRNGISKDRDTSGRYKKFVRALKSAENYLVDHGVIGDLPSYFMECLIWNVPNARITVGSTLADGFEATLSYLYIQLGDGFDEEQWEEPNRLKYLFRGHAKWTPGQGRKLILETWKHLYS